MASNTWPRTVSLDKYYGLYDLTTTLSTLTSGDEKLATVASNISAAMSATNNNGLSGNTGLYPLILLNLGTHDILANNTLDAAAHTAFVTNYRAVLSTIKSAQPSALVYSMRDWVQGRDARSDTIDDWIDESVSAEGTNSGPDERVWFKPNVATYSADGTHYYTAAGQAGAVSAWESVLP